MLSAQAYSFRQKSKLAISLSWIGGYTNVLCFLTIGVFISHITGTTTWLGRDLGQQSWAHAAFFGFILVMFFLGAVASAVMTEGAQHLGVSRKYMLPMGLEAMLLVALGLVLHHHDATLGGGTVVNFWIGGIGSFAMGLQNATITMISGSVVRTTHVTGVVTDLGLETVQYLRWYWERSHGRPWGRDGRLIRLSRRHPTALRLALLASIFGSFLFGIIVGTLMHLYAHSWALALPVAFLLWIVAMDWWKPIADVREIDMLSDPDLKAAGIVHTLLPPELGIYRLSGHRHILGQSRAPNFQAWAERLPPRWAVIILALAPITHFDSNAMMDLEQAVRRLRLRGKKIILCGITPGQYTALESGGLIETIGWENVCTDLEFAISRGVEMLGGHDAIDAARL